VDARSPRSTGRSSPKSARWGDNRRAQTLPTEVEWLANEAWQDVYWDLQHPIALGGFRNVDLYPDVEAPRSTSGEILDTAGVLQPGDALQLLADPPAERSTIRSTGAIR